MQNPDEGERRRDFVDTLMGLDGFDEWIESTNESRGARMPVLKREIQQRRTQNEFIQSRSYLRDEPTRRLGRSESMYERPNANRRLSGSSSTDPTAFSPPQPRRTPNQSQRHVSQLAAEILRHQPPLEKPITTLKTPPITPPSRHRSGSEKRSSGSFKSPAVQLEVMMSEAVYNARAQGKSITPILDDTFVRTMNSIETHIAEWASVLKRLWRTKQSQLEEAEKTIKELREQIEKLEGALEPKESVH